MPNVTIGLFVQLVRFAGAAAALAVQSRQGDHFIIRDGWPIFYVTLSNTRGYHLWINQGNWQSVIQGFICCKTEKHYTNTNGWFPSKPCLITGGYPQMARSCLIRNMMIFFPRDSRILGHNNNNDDNDDNDNDNHNNNNNTSNSNSNSNSNSTSNSNSNSDNSDNDNNDNNYNNYNYNSNSSEDWHFHPKLHSFDIPKV